MLRLVMLCLAHKIPDRLPDGQSFPFFMVFAFPIIYLVMGYLSVAVGCWLYNVMFKHIGGIEFEHGASEA